jgi:hypothetical protein
MLVSGTDRWTQLVQSAALVGLALTIYSGARFLRFDQVASAFAAGLFVVLPMPILEAATTQNDLVVSFFIAATALFTARGLRDRNLGDLAVAAAAAGLGRTYDEGKKITWRDGIKAVAALLRFRFGPM